MPLPREEERKERDEARGEVKPLGDHIDSIMKLESQVLLLSRHGKKATIRKRAERVLDLSDELIRALERLRDHL